DGVRFECTEAGAQILEAALNIRYAPSLEGDKASVIEVRENLAASTGFDIRFTIMRAGMAFEVMGHLSQENLDILQYHARWDLLRPGIQVRLSPPNLIIRKRRPDGGEDRIPDIPEINYRRITAVQLQQILNNPAILKRGGATGQAAQPAAEERAAEIVEMRVV